MENAENKMEFLYEMNSLNFLKTRELTKKIFFTIFNFPLSIFFTRKIVENNVQSYYENIQNS